MSHIYTGPDGKLYPSVTTVLDLFSYNQSLMGWANYLGFQRKDYKKELDKTAVVGTWVHAHCQKFVDPGSNPEFTDLPDPMTRFKAEKRVNTLPNWVLQVLWIGFVSSGILLHYSTLRPLRRYGRRCLHSWEDMLFYWKRSWG